MDMSTQTTSDMSAMDMTGTTHDAAMQNEHMQAMQLLLPENATHVAINSGDWSDPNTWLNGRIPSADADVHIPESITVNYDVNSNTELHFVRVDGTLSWSTTENTKMRVDTLIATSSSRLEIGSIDNPISSNVTTEIIIADNGPIDMGIDPLQLSRGIIAHGEVSIHGAQKAPYLSVADYPLAGDTSIKLDGDISNWKIGDTIVVMGVEQNGRNEQGQLLTQDEERVITSISPEGVITFETPLEFNHTAPEGYDFDVYIGNSSRNVTISSENPDGVRGHFMVMHSDGADIRFAEFHELGRTDVSVERGTMENPIGRYPLHLHRTGIGEDSDISYVVGNSITGSPGWGIVHHESHAAIDYNFVYNVQGAGIVSETGNETGQWIGNFVTSTYGDGQKLDHIRAELEGDFGYAGVAYENQSRMIIQQDNIAASSKYGWVFRSTELFESDPNLEEIQIDRSTLQFDPDPLGGYVVGEEAQIMGFTGNEAIALDVAFDSGHRVGITQETDLHSQIFDFTVWNTARAIDLMNYTGNYVIKDSTFVNGFQAIFLPTKQEGTNLFNVTIDGFKEGIYSYGYNSDGVLVDVVMKNVDTEFRTRDGQPLDILKSSDLNFVDRPIVNISENSDLVLSRGAGDDLFIAGTITDSAGTYGFANNEWYDQPRSISEGLTVEFNSDKYLTYEEAFDLHGVMQSADGTWIMPVVFWVSDRVTGEPYAYVVEISVQGFDDAYLQNFMVDAPKIPDREITVIDTWAENGVSTGEPDAGTGTDGGTGGGTDPNTSPGTDGNSGTDSGNGTDTGTGGGETVEEILYSLDGTHIFDRRADSAINLAPMEALNQENISISMSFNADTMRGAFGLISKDASDWDGGGNHLSAYIYRGELVVRFEDGSTAENVTFNGIEVGRDYDLDINLGPDGYEVYLDNTLIGQNENYAMSWVTNHEYLQIGALGQNSATGADRLSNVFDGSISDVVISTQKIIESTGETINTGSTDTGSTNTGSTDNGATDTGATENAILSVIDLDPMVEFSGSKADVISFQHDQAFEVEDAKFSFTFETDTIDRAQGLVAKDANLYEGGGNHFSVLLKNDALVFSFQDEDDGLRFTLGDIQVNQSYDVEFGVGLHGVYAIVDGVEIGRDDNYAIDLSQNGQYLHVGGSNHGSSDGSDAFRCPFDGEINDFVFSSVDYDLI